MMGLRFKQNPLCKVNTIAASSETHRYMVGSDARARETVQYAMPTTSLHAVSFLQGPPSPLLMTLDAPSASPFELYAKVASSHRPSFLFESGRHHPITGRYSFFAGEPYLTVSGRANHYIEHTADGREEQGKDPFSHLAGLFRNSYIARPRQAPPFFGGAVGYFSYDLVRQFERLPSLALDDLAMPDFEFAFFDLVAAIDHEQNRFTLAFCPPLERFLGEPREKLLREGRDRLAALAARMSGPLPPGLADTPLHLSFEPEQHRSSYADRVRRCQEYIAAGDIYQANLSHRFVVTDLTSPAVPQLLSDLLTYGRIRTLNPSPFSGLLRFHQTSLISSSPERLVRLEGRRADTRPIAGTRPRGADAAADRRLADDLRANEKERAEHIMLVDLERNDLGRVCDFGSLRVEELMTLERYSHVNHLVSHVSGLLKNDVTGFDLLRAMFPGGTITGVPKIRCMEIIEELEPVRRGAYSGSMGYVCWSGDLDFNILIRTLVKRQGRGHLQVGAGIVADSNPAREYEETIHKAQAFLSAFS
ncbi:Anthranilate synthase component 1 [Candidatus Nitrospira inopinata]|uniref:Anthranilate synthase component 1 n=2 Tax=Candidatus Nitrospira inopinata TaxID=1715989 RepID=A0A0S4KST0_9BACT|nr:Anthranilate synthase component 1 [Candidatus Nitrospira inopinata]